MRDTSTGTGKVVVNRAMSPDGFTAGPGDAMDSIFGYMTGGVEEQFPEIMAATGAMLIGRRTCEAGKRLAGEPGSEPGCDGGPEFVLTHEPPDPPDPAVTFLTGQRHAVGNCHHPALRRSRVVPAYSASLLPPLPGRLVRIGQRLRRRPLADQSLRRRALRIGEQQRGKLRARHSPSLQLAMIIADSGH